MHRCLPFVRCQQVIFKALAFLVAKPVHEKTAGGVGGQDGDDHVGGDAESSHAAEQSANQPQRAGELRKNREERKHCGDVHGAREKVHRAAEAVAAEPAEHFLRAVRKHHDAEHEPRDERRGTVVGFEEKLDGFHKLPVSLF